MTLHINLGQNPGGMLLVNQNLLKVVKTGSSVFCFESLSPGRIGTHPLIKEGISIFSSSI